MASHRDRYQTLSDLLKYPDEGFHAFVAACVSNLEDYPESLEQLTPFLDYVKGASRTELEELYIRTFDIHAVCHLDIGYVLFGEDYKRGQFLVEMKQEQIRAGNDCGAELPDHLPCVLNLLGMMEDQARAQDLVQILVLPAIYKMIQSFKKAGNVYRCVLETIQLVVEADYGKVVALPTYNQTEASL